MLDLQNSESCTTLDFKGAGNKMTVDDGIFWEKYWISEKVDFLQLWSFFIAEMMEACNKTAGSNRGLTAPLKT